MNLILGIGVAIGLLYWRVQQAGASFEAFSRSHADQLELPPSPNTTEDREP